MKRIPLAIVGVVVLVLLTLHLTNPTPRRVDASLSAAHETTTTPPPSTTTEPPTTTTVPPTTPPTTAARRPVQQPASRSNSQPRPAGRMATISDSTLYSLASCESGGGGPPHQTTKGPFHSYFQWVMSTWNSLFQGPVSPPEQVDYSTQANAVRRLIARNGGSFRSQFPKCSRLLGLP